jgi:hypothetical protein
LVKVAAQLLIEQHEHAVELLEQQVREGILLVRATVDEPLMPLAPVALVMVMSTGSISQDPAIP